MRLSGQLLVAVSVTAEDRNRGITHQHYKCLSVNSDLLHVTKQAPVRPYVRDIYQCGLVQEVSMFDLVTSE